MNIPRKTEYRGFCPVYIPRPELLPARCTYLRQNPFLAAVHTRYVHENGLLARSSCTYLRRNPSPAAVHTRYVHENGFLARSSCTYLRRNPFPPAAHTRYVHKIGLLARSSCTYLRRNPFLAAVHTRYVHKNGLLARSGCTYLRRNPSPYTKTASQRVPAVHTRYVHPHPHPHPHLRTTLHHQTPFDLPGAGMVIPIQDIGYFQLFFLRQLIDRKLPVSRNILCINHLT